MDSPSSMIDILRRQKRTTQWLSAVEALLFFIEGDFSRLIRNRRKLDVERLVGIAELKFSSRELKFSAQKFQQKN